jgi:hypothetical protein
MIEQHPEHCSRADEHHPIRNIQIFTVFLSLKRISNSYYLGHTKSSEGGTFFP